MTIPRLLIAGTGSGCGKTTVCSALLGRLTALGSRVQAFKVGPDYIDPTFHTRITGRESHNLDVWLTSENTVSRTFWRHAAQADMAVVEGVMGLYDGAAGTDEGSSGHMARLLSCPVILVLDARGMARSAAAMVRGYRDFAPGLVAGVVLNKVSGEGHYRLLKEVIETECALPVCGYLPRGAAPELPERHLGLVPEGEVEGAGLILDSLAQAARYLDLNLLWQIARCAPAQAGTGPEPARAARPVCRIGLARDAAFCFYYADSLAALAEAGAELVPFSPLADARLPEGLDGLYLGGGFPELHGQTLEANHGLRSHICRALEAGMPAYAECGGMLYLGKSLTASDGQCHAMCGFLDQDAVMRPNLQRPFGYLASRLDADSPLAPAGTVYRCHEFHYSQLSVEDGPAALTLTKADGRIYQGGTVRGNVLAGYPHLHFRGNPQLAANFVAACLRYRERHV